MKLASLSVLCLLLLLFHTPLSLAKRGGSSSGKTTKRVTTTNRGSSNTNTGQNNNQGSSSQGGQTNQGSSPRQPARPGYASNYPKSGGGGYHYRYPAQGSPYGRGYGSPGGYPGGYINHNPNNKILSPHYAGSFGYGGHGVGGGSPFSHSVQQMGVFPSDRSRGFGRSAAMAAGGGAVAGMAVGYGLGKFPRPHFHFHNRQEERHYNHYMYNKYGTRSTDTNDYSRDYTYSKPPESYDSYMQSCIKRTDLLPAENRQKNNKPAADATSKNTITTTAPDTDAGSNKTNSNITAAVNSSTSAPSTPRPLNQPEASPVPPASQVGATDDDEDDTVSIVEIGYPALIKQLKVRRCLELYMVYSDDYLRKSTGGVQGLEVGLQGFLAVVTSTIVMLLNSNM